MQYFIESSQGLSTESAAERLAREGPNALPSSKHRSIWKIALDVVREPMFILLIMGGMVYLALGDQKEAMFLLLFGAFSVVITVVQESRSERVLEALRELSSPHAEVFRDGKRIKIDSREVVREDLLLISEGNRVAADALVVSSEDLLLDESLLTGESLPVTKSAEDATKKIEQDLTEVANISKESSAIYAGTLVIRGAGLAIVQATGLQTEVGKIGLVLNKVEAEQSPLKIQIRRLVLIFAIMGGGVGLLTVLLYGLYRGSWLEALLAGLAIGMSMLPEEFPLVLAVFMAMGAWRISRANVLTRRSSAIQTLGEATLLCTDKTGTLTDNKMAVSAIRGRTEYWSRGGNFLLSAPVRSVLTVARMACAQESSDPMDLAIIRFQKEQDAEMGEDILRRRQVRSYGLRPDLLAFTALFESSEAHHLEAYAKGALEAITKLCHLTDQQLERIKKEADALAALGVRVLGLAKAIGIEIAPIDKLPESPSGFDFQYIGLIGFVDPLRADVPAAVKECATAGIRVVMITGDYPVTATAIATQAGINADRVITGDEVDAMTDRELTQAVGAVSIFARIRPQQKLRLVESFKARGEIVAMTGDGVNDAPAIKAAHIGIAMGGRGSEVAREAAAIVLLKDDFGAIVKAVRLGRRIYDNLRKSVEYIIAVHIPIAGLALVPLAFGLPLILTPIHIAFLEMVVDPACSVVFEAEREEDNVMNRPPRDASIALLPRKRVIWACVQGIFSLVVLVVVLVLAVFSGTTEPDIRALVFTSLILVNVSLIFVNRSNNAAIWRTFYVKNRSFWVLFVGIFGALVPMLLWSPVREMFRLGNFHVHDMLICVVAAIANVVVLQTIKSRWFVLPEISRLPLPKAFTR
jgi:P-type Ca2+ transporter type 2C